MNDFAAYLFCLINHSLKIAKRIAQYAVYCIAFRIQVYITLPNYHSMPPRVSVRLGGGCLPLLPYYQTKVLTCSWNVDPRSIACYLVVLYKAKHDVYELL